MNERERYRREKAQIEIATVDKLGQVTREFNLALREARRLGWKVKVWTDSNEEVRMEIDRKASKI